MRLYVKGLLAAVVLTVAAASPAQAKFIANVGDPTASTYQSSFHLTGAAGLDFYVQNTPIQPTGTGVIDSFLRIQQNGQERGYNTSARDGSQAPLDDKNDPNFTRDLLLGDVPIVVIDGVAYREFLLDINQIQNGLVSMNQVQIFQSANHMGATTSDYSLQEANLTGGGHDAVISFAGLTNVFRMNNAQNNGTNLDTNIEVQVDSATGSGSGDMFLYVRNSVFTQDANSFITLFSQFGRPSGTYTANSGFEEWAVVERGPDTNPVPAPPSAVLALIGLAGTGFGYFARRRRLAIA